LSLLIFFECLICLLVWWRGFGIALLLVLVDWFMDKWEQRRWRAAILWTLGMSVLLVAVVTLTEHFGWGIGPIRV
jgi:hypothetical protein